MEIRKRERRRKMSEREQMRPAIIKARNNHDEITKKGNIHDNDDSKERPKSKGKYPAN